MLFQATGQERKAGRGCGSAETRGAVKPDAGVFLRSACSVGRACAGGMGRRGAGRSPPRECWGHRPAGSAGSCAVKPVHGQQVVVKQSAVFTAGATQEVQAASVQKARTPRRLSGKGF